MSGKIFLNQDFIHAVDVNNEVLITHGTNVEPQFFKLKGCDAAIFSLLKKNNGATIADLRSALLDEYDVDGLPIDEYLPRFIDLLASKGFISVK